jgi:hypothetical protein
LDDPEHVLIATFEGDTLAQEAMDNGELDAFGTHGGYDVCDCMTQVMLNYLVLGQDVQKEINPPMSVMTPDNVRSHTGNPYWDEYGTLYWTVMPSGRWEAWPVCDYSSLGVEWPTLELRKELKGY